MSSLGSVYLLNDDWGDTMAVALSEGEAISVCKEKGWTWRTVPVVRYEKSKTKEL